MKTRLRFSRLGLGALPVVACLLVASEFFAACSGHGGHGGGFGYVQPFTRREMFAITMMSQVDRFYPPVDAGGFNSNTFMDYYIYLIKDGPGDFELGIADDITGDPITKLVEFDQKAVRFYNNPNISGTRYADTATVYVDNVPYRPSVGIDFLTEFFEDHITFRVDRDFQDYYTGTISGEFRTRDDFGFRRGDIGVDSDYGQFPNVIEFINTVNGSDYQDGLMADAPWGSGWTYGDWTMDFDYSSFPTEALVTVDIYDFPI